MADMQKIKDLFSKVISKRSDMTASDVEKVEQNSDKVEEVIGVVQGVFGDGLQLSDVTAIGNAVAPAMKLASGFKDYGGSDKKRFVVELVWLVYKTIDTYPDGKSNNINVPWVFGTLESKLEHSIVTLAAGMAVDALYDRMKKDEEV